MNFMRLSSMKAAHAAVVWCRLQEIRVKPSFGLSGIMAVDVPLLVCRGRPREMRYRVLPPPRVSGVLTQTLPGLAHVWRAALRAVHPWRVCRIISSSWPLLQLAGTRLPFRAENGSGGTAGPSTPLPRISCRAWWRWRASCGFLYGKPHTRPCPARRDRKSGCARSG
jgi:hypothetical protein